MLLMTKFEGLVVQQPIKEKALRESLRAFLFLSKYLSIFNFSFLFNLHS